MKEICDKGRVVTMEVVKQFLRKKGFVNFSSCPFWHKAPSGLAEHRNCCLILLGWLEPGLVRTVGQRWNPQQTPCLDPAGAWGGGEGVCVRALHCVCWRNVLL